MPVLEPDPDTDPGTLDPDRHQIAFVPISRCCRTCAGDPSDEGTSLVFIIIDAFSRMHSLSPSGSRVYMLYTVLSLRPQVLRSRGVWQ